MSSSACYDSTANEPNIAPRTRCMLLLLWNRTCPRPHFSHFVCGLKDYVFANSCRQWASRYVLAKFFKVLERSIYRLPEEHDEGKGRWHVGHAGSWMRSSLYHWPKPVNPKCQSYPVGRGLTPLPPTYCSHSLVST